MFFSENIRPSKVIKALHWLLNHSTLSKNANITVDNNWLHKFCEEDNTHAFLNPNENFDTEQKSAQCT